MPPSRRSRPQSDPLDWASLTKGWRSAWSPANQAQSALFACALALLFISVIFGGASQGTALSLMAVELASLPLLFVSLYLVLAGAAPKGVLWPLILLAAIVALPLVQLIPLPAAIWTRLPGRQPALAVLDLTHQGHVALPFSLAPEQTWRMAMALAPPAAMFMGGMFFGPGQRRAMVICWLGLAVVSLTIGAAQLLGGDQSPLYFYAITNPGSLVGLFSNRNHEAEYLLCLLPLAAVFAAGFDGVIEGRRLLGPLLTVVYLLLAIIGVAVTRSRAGIALTAFSLLGAAAVALRGGRMGRRWTGAIGVGLVGLAAVGAVLIFGLGPILERFGSGGEPRFTGWPIAQGAAMSFMPLGSGLGSFEQVYRSVEPLKDVSPIYFNHAHNDFLELWLETGVVGPALLLIFAGWYAMRSWAIWRGGVENGGDLAAACTLTMLLLIAHSAVDYPLRTEALATLFAFCCATIATWRTAGADTA